MLIPEKNLKSTTRVMLIVAEQRTNGWALNAPNNICNFQSRKRNLMRRLEFYAPGYRNPLWVPDSQERNSKLTLLVLTFTTNHTLPSVTQTLYAFTKQFSIKIIQIVLNSIDCFIIATEILATKKVLGA